MKNILVAMGRVFSRIRYVLLALVVALLLLLFSIWLPNLPLVWDTIVSMLTTPMKFTYLYDSLGAFNTNFSLSSQITTSLIALLFGIHVSLVTFYFINRISTQRSAGIGTLGILSGIVGIGCAACGSVVLSTLIGVGAATGFLGALPFHGLEFTSLGIALLIVAISVVSKKITDPMVCPVK